MMRRFAVLVALVPLALLWGPRATAAEDGYVGEDTCLECHEDKKADFEKTIHYRAFREGNARTERMTHGCEACHGPGQAHVEAGGGKGTGGPEFVTFSGGSPADVSHQNASCLGCHDGGKLMLWKGSSHDLRGNACNDCHNVHQKISTQHQLKFVTEEGVCSQCHLLPRSQGWRNAHHPKREGPASATLDIGREGFLECTDCHNPHGTVTEHLLTAASVNDKCYGCHADKRGPFLWEHPPVQEDCLNCHSPHGSIHPHMLKVAQPRLCQACHDPSRHPTEARLPGSRFVLQQSCNNCHFNIHGSNHPSGMFFTR
jgi:DmsE family decaheme c-type cytochrome